MFFNQEKYKFLLGEMESHNDYSIENNIGALGKYQFMSSTLNSLQSNYNLSAWKNKNYFLSSPMLQEQYEDALIKDSLNYIKRNDLEKYLGKVVKGSKRFKSIASPLNVYGMLAAIHLSGATALKNFLLYGSNPDDGLTSLSDYAAYFSNKLSTFGNATPIIFALLPAIVLYYVK